jgi:hypothetical protein
MTLAGTGIRAQETEPGHKGEPDVKWDVRKEYDEHGNLIFYDSSYVRTWKHFDLPGCGQWHALKELDSLFGDFPHFPEGLFEHHPFAFGPIWDFMDSLYLDFHPDSLCFHRPLGFSPFKGFPDSAWMDPFFPGSRFPDVYMPFEEFHLHPFFGPEGFFDRHNEWMEKFLPEFSFPDDSSHHFYPKWQQLPRHQKKSARGIEI